MVSFNGEVEIELDDRVIDVVHDEWRASIYSHLHTAEDIVKHIAFNIVLNHAHLSMLDGWADQPDKNAKVKDEYDWELDVREITE